WRKGWIKGSYFIDRVVSRFVTAYIAVSEANREYLQSEKGLPVERIFVIRNGSSLERFDPALTAPPGLRAVLNLNEDVPVVVALARLEPQKGHRVLLEAWKLVSQAFPDAHLVCVGGGMMAPELVALAAALGIAGSVSLVGWQANVPEWLAL